MEFEEFSIGDLAKKPAELKNMLEENRFAIEKLIAMKAKTFNNFARAISELDEKLARFMTPISIAQYTENSPETKLAYEAILPIISEYETANAQDTRLLAAFSEILENDRSIDNAQKKVLEDLILDFALEGALLDKTSKERIAEINSRLADIDNLFSQNLLDAAKSYEKIIDESDLSGIEQSDLGAFKNGDKFALSLLPHAYTTFMTYAENRNLRGELYKEYVTRAPQNEDILEEMLRLKDEKAKLLKMRHYADYSLRTKMAEKSENAVKFVKELIDKSLPQARKELNELKEFAKARGFNDEMRSFDFAFWSKKYERQKFDIDDEAYKPYFEAFGVLGGLFNFLGKLFSVEFDCVNAAVWNANARTFNLTNNNGTFARLFVDLFERKSKRGGAWMDAYQTRMRRSDGALLPPSAYICCNFPPPDSEGLSLLRHDDVVTLFHEMGHAIHHLFSRVDERDASGINGVEWDAVEFPSQWLENFAYSPQVLRLFARHYKSGEILSDEMIAKLAEAKNFQSALSMLRQCEFALFDLKVHQGAFSKDKVQEILDQTRAETSLIKPPKYNKFQNGFSHIFGGGYSAGYYSYKWAEVLSADAYFEFADRGIFDRSLAERFLENVLSAGGSRKASENFRAFANREPRSDALLRLSQIGGF